MISLNEIYTQRVCEIFINDVGVVEQMLPKSEAIRYGLVQYYKELVKSKIIPPMETIEQEAKREIYKQSLGWEPLQMKKSFRVQLCYCIYVMIFYLENFYRHAPEQNQ